MWMAVIGALSLVGIGVQGRLHRTDISVSGTPGTRADAVAQRYFGRSQSLVVVLQGPRSAIDTQGAALATRLEHIPRVAVLGPWVSGAPAALRPRPDEAIVLIRADRDFEDVARHVVPAVRHDVTGTITPPLAAHVSGYPDVSNGLNSASIDALKRAELIAAPLLLIVLLLVFRSLVAAAIPLVLGMTSVGAAGGLLDIVNRFTPVDAVGLNMASMFGLALGVDYSLLVVSRFREELATGADVPTAAAIATRTAGRTAVFAGGALALAMIAATALAPGNVLVSSGVGTVAATVVSVASAATALPALLVVIGRNVNRWQIGHARAGGGRWASAAVAAAGRPAVTAALVLVVLGALAAPALALQMSSPDPRELPHSRVERRDFDAIVNALPGSWPAPFNVLIASPRGPVTSPRNLDAIAAWQRQLSSNQKVQAVLGPASIAARASQARSSYGTLKGKLASGQGQLDRLSSGLTSASSGVSQLRAGVARASAGASELSHGGTAATDGAARLAAGVAQAQAGADRLQSGLAASSGGASQLASGADQARAGAATIASRLSAAAKQVGSSRPAIARLSAGLHRGSSQLGQLREPVGVATSGLSAARAALDRMLITSKNDPAYADARAGVLRAIGAISGRNPVTGEAVASGYDGLDNALTAASSQLSQAARGVDQIGTRTRQLESGLGRLASGAHSLESGVERLRAGARRLSDGLRQLDAGGSSLTGGLAALRSGSGSLESGIARLNGGASTLASSLQSGYSRSAALASGVGQLRSGVAGAGVPQPGGGAGLTPSLFDSGYLTLAGLDSAAPDARTASTFSVNLDSGGSATRLVVVDRGNPAKQGDPLRGELERTGREFSRRTGLTVAVGGAAATLQDFPATASSRLPLMIAVLLLLTYVALVPIVRSLVLPLLAVLLNLLTVAAAFGVLTLGFQGSAPLGGPGSVDAIMVLAIFSIVFGLSIDYEVFLLARIREGYTLTGDTAAAVEYGVRRTATVITGAALIMTGVFVAFALSDVTNMRQLGVGLTVAVLLDATVVRLLLLPSAIRLAGRANWWLPGPLKRWLDPAPPPPPPAASESSRRFRRPPNLSLDAELSRLGGAGDRGD